MQAAVTKEVFLAGFTCRTKGWLMGRKEDGEPTVSALFRMDQGKEVHRRARNAFPGGAFPTGGNTAELAESTQRLMADSQVHTVYEATFGIDGYVTRADILRRHGDGWDLIETKSSVNDKPELVDDLAYTAMVMQRSGVKLVSSSLRLVSKDFRLGMGDDKLLVGADHTADTETKVAAFLPTWDSVHDETTAAACPEPHLTFDCKNCEYFWDECMGKGCADHIFELPYISEKRFDALIKAGITCIRNIPKGFGLTDPQERVRRCVVAGAPEHSGKLAAELATIRWPAFYLDFETFQTAIPPYTDLAPYTQVPTQYSVHICSSPGAILGHREYLADHTRDCRRELAERLIADLKGDGSILAYSGFEKTTINRLAGWFEDLAPSLGALVGRLVDLKGILDRGLYHPGFHGSYSIKDTLPVLVPGMGYAGMAIRDGEYPSGEPHL